MPVYEGNLDGSDLRIAIVAARFNGVITSKLVEGAIETLARCGLVGERVDLVWVPGSFEIPSTAQRLATTARYAAVLCLGCVVRGDTDHYKFVAGEAARGVAEVSRASGVPVIFGILTTDTVEQAMERATPPHNAGSEAAETAIKMANLWRQLPTAAQSVQ